MVILLLLLALVLIMVTVYLLGLLPGTGPYAIRRYELNAVKGIENKSFQEKCVAVKKIKSEEFKKDERFFTFSGFKTIMDLLPYPDVPTLYDMCMRKDEGEDVFVEEDAIEDMLRSSGIEAAAVKWKGGAPCDEVMQGVNRIAFGTARGVIRADGDIVSLAAYFKDTKPDVHDFRFACRKS